MDPSQPALAALDLHLRELEIPDAPADTAAFARPLRADAFAADDLERLVLESAALAEGMLRLPQARDGRLIPLFDEGAALPIPRPVAAPADDAADHAPLGDAWAIPRALPVTVAVAPRGPIDPRRTLVVAAVALPLALRATPSLAVAAEPAVQRPKGAEGPPALPPARTQETLEEGPLEPMPAPPQPEVSAPLAGAEGADAADADAVEGPAPASDGPGVSESYWQAMRGEEVKLLLPGGARTGRLVKVDGPEVIFVDYDNRGALVSVPKHAVMELRGVIRESYGRPQGVPDPTLPTGNGLLAGGGVAVGVGTPFFLSGVVIAGLCGFGSCTSITVPLAVPGLLMIGGGVAMLVLGARRKRAWRESAFHARLRPSFGGSQRAWTGALTLHF